MKEYEITYNKGVDLVEHLQLQREIERLKASEARAFSGWNREIEAHRATTFKLIKLQEKMK